MFAKGHTSQNTAQNYNFFFIYASARNTFLKNDTRALFSAISPRHLCEVRLFAPKNIKFLRFHRRNMRCSGECYLFEIGFVDLIEGGVLFAVDIEYGDYFPVLSDGYDDLALRSGRTGYVSGKLVDVRHDECFVLLPSRSADSLTERDTRAGNRALEGA